MSDSISKMDFKQLRNEVQLLRDELAIMKRKYEDILYNLDDDNFSSKILREKDNMKTEIKVTADGIKTKVSKEELDKTLSGYSTIEQTSDKISTAITNVNEATDTKLQNYSTVKQTAESITSTVTKEYIKAKVDGEYATAETLKSEIKQASDGITTRVEKLESGRYDQYTLFKQTADTFLFDGEKVVFTGYISLTDNNGVQVFNIFHDETGFAEPLFVIWGRGSHSNDSILIGGDTSKIYIGKYTTNTEVATKGWVEEQLSKLKTN